MSYSTQFQSAVRGGIGGGGGFSSSFNSAARLADLKEIKTVGQFLDLYVIHFLVTLVFIIGGIILTWGYTQNVNKPYTAATDFFIALGAIALAMNILFAVATIGAWIAHLGSFLSRDDDKIHWLHVISIMSSAMIIGWGLYALVLMFGQVLTSSVPNETLVAGYFMVAVTVIYAVYLVVRYALGLAGRRAQTVPSQTNWDTLNRASLLSSLNYQRPVPSPAPFAGGAIFSGIDLSGLQPSTITTSSSPPQQQQMPCSPMPMPCYYPPGPQMMSYGGMPCAPNENAAVRL